MQIILISRVKQLTSEQHTGGKAAQEPKRKHIQNHSLFHQCFIFYYNHNFSKYAKCRKTILNSIINCIITAALAPEITVSLENFTNMLHLQYVPIPFCPISNYLNVPQVEAKFTLHQFYQDNATYYYNEENLNLCTSLLAVLKKELARNFPTLCLTLI